MLPLEVFKNIFKHTLKRLVNERACLKRKTSATIDLSVADSQSLFMFFSTYKMGYQKKLYL